MRIVDGGQVVTTARLKVRGKPDEQACTLGVLGEGVIWHATGPEANGWVPGFTWGWHAGGPNVRSWPGESASLKVYVNDAAALQSYGRGIDVWDCVKLAGFVSGDYVAVIDSPA